MPSGRLRERFLNRPTEKRIPPACAGKSAYGGSCCTGGGEAVSAALEKRFGPAADDDMETKLEDISKSLALECWNNRQEDILEAVPGSFLEEYDAINVEIFLPERCLRQHGLLHDVAL